jgi:quinol monooxygenase YgiN
MKSIERSVSLHPYFKVHAGQMDAATALLREFVARTASEPGMLFYEFTLNGDEVFCREAYTGAAGVLAHLDNVKSQLEKMLTLSALARLEIHGPAAELDQLRGPLGALQPAWFVYECGVQR